MANLNAISNVVRARQLGLIVDFDGTISEIAPTPDEAQITPEAAAALGGLAGRLALVSVMSGRSVGDLRDKVNIEGLVYVGNHGAEYLSNGRLEVAPNAANGCESVVGVFNALRAAVHIQGLVWQQKGFSASVHYRLAPNADEARLSLSDALVALPEAAEIEVFWGKMVLELRAPHGLNKGFATRKLAKDYALQSILFMGDDTTDVDALMAVRELACGDSFDGVGIAALHEDSPASLLEAADYSLDGVWEVGQFLTWLDGETGC